MDVYNDVTDDMACAWCGTICTDYGKEVYKDILELPAELQKDTWFGGDARCIVVTIDQFDDWEEKWDEAAALFSDMAGYISEEDYTQRFSDGEEEREMMPAKEDKQKIEKDKEIECKDNKMKTKKENNKEVKEEKQTIEREKDKDEKKISNNNDDNKNIDNNIMNKQDIKENDNKDSKNNNIIEEKSNNILDFKNIDKKSSEKNNKYNKKNISEKSKNKSVEKEDTNEKNNINNNNDTENLKNKIKKVKNPDETKRSKKNQKNIKINTSNINTNTVDKNSNEFFQEQALINNLNNNTNKKINLNINGKARTIKPSFFNSFILSISEFLFFIPSLCFFKISIVKFSSVIIVDNFIKFLYPFSSLAYKNISWLFNLVCKPIIGFM